MDLDLNLKRQIITLLDKKIREKICPILALVMTFFDMILMAQATESMWDSPKSKLQEWVISLSRQSFLQHKSGFGLQTHVQVEREN